MTDAPAPHVFDATAANFETEVIQRSLQVPVLVDFWATWCGPCKTLGPILEKLAGEYAGAFRLAKIDCDKEQQLAGMFGVRSIPTVVLIQGGQIVDAFSGALPESQVREFLKRHQVEPASRIEAPAQDTENGAPAPAETPKAAVARIEKSNTRRLGPGELSVYVDVFNVYGRNNPRGLGYTVADWNSAEVVANERSRLQLPRIPTIGVRWTF